MNYYFISHKLSEHVYRIEDSCGDCCYLVVGTERACLIDTLIGVGDLKGFVENITKLPLTVILTHSHLDHIGGAGQFDHAYIREEEAPVLAIHKEIAFRADIFITRMKRDFKVEDFLPVDSSRLLPLPDDWVLDLGGVTVELLHVPGHTKGTICPLIPEDRILLIGDECDDNVLLDMNSVTVRTYMENLQRLVDMADRYDRILGNHGSFTYSMETLTNVLECCRRILAHEDEHILVQMLDKTMYSCCARNEKNLRADGKSGNVLYMNEVVD